MNIFRVPKLLMTIDSRDSLDSARKKIPFLSKKVNELFVDRNVNVVSLHRENQARFYHIFLQPLRVTKFPLKGNKKTTSPAPSQGGESQNPLPLGEIRERFNILTNLLTPKNNNYQLWQSK